MKVVVVSYPTFSFVNKTPHILIEIPSRGVGPMCAKDAKPLAEPTPTNFRELIGGLIYSRVSR